MFGLESSQWLPLAGGLLGVVNLLLLRVAGRDRRRLQAILKDLEGATAPTLARSLTTETAQDGAVLARLMGLGLVREALPGHFYTVESEWQIRRDRQRRRVIPFWSAIIAIPVFMIWLMG